MNRPLLLFLSILFTTFHCLAPASAQDGSLDLTFNPGQGVMLANDDPGRVHSIALQEDGKILIGGRFGQYNGVARKGIARLNADGSLDTSFDPGTGTGPGSSNGRIVFSIAIQPDGKIVIGGDFENINGIARSGIARLNADGSLDTSFDPGAGVDILSPELGIKNILLQPDGKILAGGQFSQFNGSPISGIVRLNSDGSLDSSFDPGTSVTINGVVNAIALQTDGRILLAGYFTEFNGSVVNEVIRLNADGTIDPTFDTGEGPVSIGALPGQATTLYHLNVQTDGRIIVAGHFQLFDGEERNHIVRLYANGSLDTSFDPSDASGLGAGAAIYSTIIQPDGKIVIGGNFNWFQGAGHNSIVRLETNGTVDPTFNPGYGVVDAIYTMTRQPDGRIVLGGNLEFYDNTMRYGIARINNGLETSIENERQSSPLQTHPNPASSSITIVTDGLVGTGTATILDMSGRAVRSLSLSSSQTAIDISDLRSGMYLLHFSDERNTGTVRLVKQ